jgi:hypothetical protein
MSIQRDTRSYEKWLRKECQVVRHDLDRKHKRMASDPFMFLRATYYSWARKIEKWCPELGDAPHVLAVGDVHTENFGIWRDREGRLVWGINDFDEAAPMPYLFDLVRLATSARLAPGLPLTPAEVGTAILGGYQRGLKKPGPTLLAERKAWMRPLLDYSGKAGKEFWSKVGNYPEAKPHPKVVASRLRESLPRHAEILRFCSRSVGGGSLGRPRFVAVAQWRGGYVLREAKAFVTSAWRWAHDQSADHSSFIKLAHGRYRSPDPFLKTQDRFIYRRIAADARKIELGEHAGRRLHRALLDAMGFDLGAIHAAHPRHVRKIRRDLKKRPRDWLTIASDAAATNVRREHESWRSTYKAERQ